MKKEELRFNWFFIIRKLEDLYTDVSKRMIELDVNLYDNKMHFEIYNDIWQSLTESTNIKMYDIKTMLRLLDAINTRLTQLAMLNDCEYSKFVERLNQIKLLVLKK